MKINKIVHLFRPGTGFLILLAGIFLFAGLSTMAQEKKKKKKKENHFEVEASFATIYDNNILKYSDKYIDRFLNNQDQGRFHITSYDDFILYQSAEVAATYRIVKKLKTRFNVSFFTNEYMYNNIKNWYFVSFGLQQYITKKASFKIFYNYIPHFYVRHFRDEDWVNVYGYTPETFVQFAFSKDNYGFWIQNTFFENSRVRLAFDHARYYHNAHYTEYDCKNYTGGVSLFQPLHKNVRLELSYEYEYSDAKGYDEPGESKESADDADATYNEYGFALGVDVKLPEIRKKANDVDMKIAYQKRFYLSEHYLEEDREHTGRVDDNLQIVVNYGIELSNSFRLGAYYKYFMRDTDTESVVNQIYLSGEKDYNQSQFGLQLTYNIKF